MGYRGDTQYILLHLEIFKLFTPRIFGLNCETIHLKEVNLIGSSFCQLFVKSLYKDHKYTFINED